jgi:hypothetical protein
VLTPINRAMRRVKRVSRGLGTVQSEDRFFISEEKGIPLRLLLGEEERSCFLSSCQHIGHAYLQARREANSRGYARTVMRVRVALPTRPACLLIETMMSMPELGPAQCRSCRRVGVAHSCAA